MIQHHSQAAGRLELDSLPPKEQYKAVLLGLLWIGTLIIGSATLATAFAEPLAEQQATDWIWISPRPLQEDSHRQIFFEKRFHVDHNGTTAQLRYAPCFAFLRVKLDGILIGTASPFSGMQETQFEQSLSEGSHSLTVEAVGIDGPSAFFTELALVKTGHPRRIIASSPSWNASSQPPSSQTQPTHETLITLGPIENSFTRTDGQQVGIGALDNYEQWKLALEATEGKQSIKPKFSIASGFRIQEIPFTEKPDPDLGSWVSMTIDPEGRPIIANESSGLLRLTLSAKGDSIETAEWINRDLQECRGLTFRGKELFANANNSKGLYRLRPDGDGFADPELIFKSSGGVGHGRNDLAVGPDNMLYSIHGDAVDLPRNAIDHTSPYREASRGSNSREGHLLRLDPDNGSVELLVSGLRNPYGIDFNQYGDCFTYDADAEHDMGAPWYRPTRVLHLTTGSDFGWRGVTGSWPAYYPDHPDNAVPGLDIGKGSPTAVKFGTKSNFPSKYREGLFILDWAYGRILLVNMLPNGSSYSMTSETFLKGRPLNVTDLDFAADGSMYLITGGRKTQSKLYRVTYAGKRKPASQEETDEITDHRAACHRFSSQSRRTRRELETLLTHDITDEQFHEAWEQLGNTDPWISHAAARVIERVPITQWEEKALREPIPKIAVRAITCLLRSQENQQTTRAVKRLAELAEKSNSFSIQTSQHESTREHAFYGIQLALSTSQQSLKELAPEVTGTLAKMYRVKKASSGRTAANTATQQFHYPCNRLLSEILATSGNERFVSTTLDFVQQATRPDQRLHFLYVLRNVTDGWTPKLRRLYFKYLAMASEEQGGAGLPDFLQRIREDAMKHVPDSERASLATSIGANAAVKRQPDLLHSSPRVFIQDWTVEKLLRGKQPVGDKHRGKKVYAAAGCIHCHRFSTEGRLLGPDLTAAMRRYSRRDLLAAIIRPSDVIAEDYQSVQILTNEGQVITGQITRGVDFRSPILRIATNPERPSFVIEVQKSAIMSRQTSKVSWMPDGLLDTFSRQQVFDLVAYLESSP